MTEIDSNFSKKQYEMIGEYGDRNIQNNYKGAGVY